MLKTTKVVVILVLIAGFLPQAAFGTVEAWLSVPSEGTANEYEYFSVNVNGLPDNLAKYLARVTVSGSDTIKALEIHDGLSWQTLALDTMSGGVYATATAISEMKFRIKFSEAKLYLVGVTVLDNSSSVVSSVALPVKINQTKQEAPKVLGVPLYIFDKNLSKGSRGMDVTQLQTRLMNEGYYSGPITGYFGNLTHTAVIDYQMSKGLPQVGIVGPKTRQVLNS